MSIIDDVLSLIGVKQDEPPTPAEVRDESQGTLEAQRASALKVRTRAAETHAKESATYEADARAAEDAQAKLDSLLYDRGDDQDVADAKGALDLAVMRRDASRRRAEDAASVLRQVDDELAKIDAEVTRIKSEREHARLVEAASIERLRADCAEDETIALRARDEMESALARIAHRFDDANAAAVKVDLPKLDSMHAFGGLLTKLAKLDPRHADRFINDSAQLRHSLKSPANSGLIHSHKFTDLVGFITTLVAPPTGYAPQATVLDDLAVLLSERTWHDAEAALHAARHARSEAAANTPEALAEAAVRQAAFAANQERLRNAPRPNQYPEDGGASVAIR